LERDHAQPHDADEDDERADAEDADGHAVMIVLAESHLRVG
jgi:hypothetical protein